eukprot:GILI01007012.1.p2 GENE.GILI01007012.1~~GILI01007012.1.p2  ORF type:complete len:112 (+),score=32.08 GILI01007012.1:44-337(+)
MASKAVIESAAAVAARIFGNLPVSNAGRTGKRILEANRVGPRVVEYYAPFYHRLLYRHCNSFVDEQIEFRREKYEEWRKEGRKPTRPKIGGGKKKKK